MSRDRTDWVLVGLLFCIGLLAAAQFGKVSLTLVEVGAAYGRADTGVAFLVSLVGGVGVVLGVVAGRVIANLGAARCLVAAMLLGAALSAAQAALPPLWLMTLLRLAEGVSHLAIVVSAPPLMARAASDRDRPVAMSLWAMFFGVSFALSALVFPRLLSAGGLPLLFVLHGLALAALAMIVRTRLPRLATSAQPVAFLAEHRAIYGDPHLCGPALGFVFYTITFVALLTFLPERLARPELAASLPLVSLVGTFGAGWLARRVAPDLIAIAGFALSLPATAILMSDGLWAAWLLFLALGAVPGSSFASIPWLNQTDEARARATGAIAQMGNVGTTSGTPLFAALLALSGLGGLYAGIMAFGVAGIAALYWARRARLGISCRP